MPTEVAVQHPGSFRANDSRAIRMKVKRTSRHVHMMQAANMLKTDGKTSWEREV